MESACRFSMNSRCRTFLDHCMIDSQARVGIIFIDMRY